MQKSKWGKERYWADKQGTPYLSLATFLKELLATSTIHFIGHLAICQFLMPSVTMHNTFTVSCWLLTHPPTNMEDHPLLAASFADILHV
jgi:hypothetical protein